MHKFKIGDKVRRNPMQQSGGWLNRCSRFGKKVDAVYTVNGCIAHSTYEIVLAEFPGEWYEDYFDLVPQRSRQEVMEDL